MKKLLALKAWLEGKKTYIVAVVAALDGLYQYYVQHGLNFKALVVYLLCGGGLASLRAAINKL